MNYSGKNIPLPTKCLLEKIELVIKRMHWKAHFFLKKNDTEEENDSASEPENDHAYYGLKSKRTPPKIDEMANFERDMLNIVDNLKFRQVKNEFQSKLDKDVRDINASNRVFVHADKTRNIYQMKVDDYRKTLQDNITTK